MKYQKITEEEFRAKGYTGYDKSVGECHIANYGCVYIDEYDSPIDDEYVLEYIVNELECVKK